MSLFADTSVWSLALRRDAPPDVAEVVRLSDALNAGELVFTTGIVLQELLQGYAGPRAQAEIVERFRALPLLSPDLDDHIKAARLRNECRRRGIQVGTIDALLAQLCIANDLLMLTSDQDFAFVSEHSALRLWRS